MSLTCSTSARHWTSACYNLQHCSAPTAGSQQFHSIDHFVMSHKSMLSYAPRQVRHGALLGLAALLPALAAAGGPGGLGAQLEDLEQGRLAGLVSDIEAARLLRGRGGEPMRAALCR